MVTNINSSTDLSTSLRGTRSENGKAREARQAGSETPEVKQTETSEVNLSDTARELQKLAQSDETPVRQDKVEALKAALARGESIIDSDAVAQNMLDLEL